jgi:hypothetical protein
MRSSKLQKVHINHVRMRKTNATYRQANSPRNMRRREVATKTKLEARTSPRKAPRKPSLRAKRRPKKRIQSLRLSQRNPRRRRRKRTRRMKTKLLLVHRSPRPILAQRRLVQRATRKRLQ